MGSVGSKNNQATFDYCGLNVTTVKCPQNCQPEYPVRDGLQSFYYRYQMNQMMGQQLPYQY